MVSCVRDGSGKPASDALGARTWNGQPDLRLCEGHALLIAIMKILFRKFVILKEVTPDE